MVGAFGHNGSRGEKAQMTHVCAGSWDPYTPASKTHTYRVEMNSQDAWASLHSPGGDYELLCRVSASGIQ